ncbi:MAG: metallophosphoesterase [Chloroflexota bacterium]|nr:metallophosphoesterase [Chloroflexota bacterium]
MRFVVLGDLHFSSYSSPTHRMARNRFFKALFTQVVKLQPDLIFALGDTTNRGTIEELSEQDELAAKSDLRLSRITGNHDTDSLEKPEIASFFLGDHPSASPSELYTSFDHGATHFVLLDTSRVKVSEVDWSGFVSDDQLTWLKEEIARFNAETESKNFIVLGHHPLYDTTHRSIKEGLNITNSQAVQDIFATLVRGHGIYFSGHNHSNSIFGPDSLGWHYLQVGAPLNCQSFQVVTVTQDSFELETIDLDLSEPELRADFETTRCNIEGGFKLYPLEIFRGTPADRKLCIKLNQT